MKKIILATFLLSISYFTFWAQEEESIRKEINKIIRYETNIDFKETPGFIVGMIDEKNDYIIPFGQKQIGDSLMLTETDAFEIGGIAKIFTSLLLYKLKDEYHVKLDSSINDYLPIKNKSFQACSIYDLLRHTSGLPKYPPGWGSKEIETQNPYAHFNQSDLENFYQEYNLPPKATANSYLYSHLNFVLIQWMLEHIAGENYNDLLKKYLPQYFKDELLSQKYTLGYGHHLKPIAPWTSTTFTGALGIKSNLKSLLVLCRDFLEKDKSEYNQMLEISKMKVRKENGFVANGWQAIPITQNRFIYYHTGRTDGHYTFIAMLPNTKTAVGIMANSATGADLLGINVLRMMNENWRRK